MSTKQPSAVEALLEVQKGIETVKKNARNDHFKNGYADLTAIMEAIKGPLNDAGFVIVQKPEPSESIDTIKLTTELIHTSGDRFSCTATAPLEKRGPQAYGSALTYLRRYSLVSLLGIATEDDDGNGASKNGNGHHQPASEPRKTTPAPAQEAKPTEPKGEKPWGKDDRISEKQGKRLFAICRKSEVPDDVLKNYLKSNHGIEHTYEIRWQKYDAICKWAETWAPNTGDDVPEPPMAEEDIPF